MIKKFFARANSAQGAVNLTMNNLKGIENLYILSGESQGLKTYLIKILLSQLEDKYNQIECLVNPFNISYLDGIIVRDIKFAAISADILPLNTFGKVIDLNEALLNTLNNKKDLLSSLLLSSKSSYAQFYKEFEDAKKVHDDWEKIYISNMDFDSLNAYTKGIIKELCNKKSESLSFDKFERFFGASTPDGSVNYIDNITQGLKIRYFIKGRPGSGKSTFMKTLSNELLKNGYSVELYRCSLDTNSLDMVLCPELSYCVFDSTQPHEMFPESERDKILDFAEVAGLYEIDEKFKKDLDFLKKKYSMSIAKGLAHLRVGFLSQEEREFYFDNACDKTRIDVFADKILRSIDV